MLLFLVEEVSVTVPVGLVSNLTGLFFDFPKGIFVLTLKTKRVCLWVGSEGFNDVLLYLYGDSNFSNI